MGQVLKSAEYLSISQVQIRVLSSSMQLTLTLDPIMNQLRPSTKKRNALILFGRMMYWKTPVEVTCKLFVQVYIYRIKVIYKYIIFIFNQDQDLLIIRRMNLVICIYTPADAKLITCFASIPWIKICYSSLRHGDWNHCCLIVLRQAL